MIIVKDRQNQHHYGVRIKIEPDTKCKHYQEQLELSKTNEVYFEWEDDQVIPDQSFGKAIICPLCKKRIGYSISERSWVIAISRGWDTL